MPLRTRDDLSMAYTPGVGRVSMAIHDNPEDVRKLTIKGNSVAVVTDGSAVLGLGNIGPGAAMPVMEGKAALFKRFADIDAWPICLASQDTDEIVKAVEMIAPGFGGINLEDIAAPRCFEIEAGCASRSTSRSSTTTSTAPRSWCSPRSPTRCAAWRSSSPRCGSSSPAPALPAPPSSRCSSPRARRTSSSSTARAPSPPATSRCPPPTPSWPRATNPRRATGSLREVLVDADVFVGVSAPGILDPEWIPTMAPKPVVFALANPDPEVDPAEADKYAAVVASGRSDYPNQINNVLAFPGVFRGLLDARRHRGDRRHAAARRPGDRRHRERRGAARGVHHPERVPPRRDRSAVASAISGREG